MKRLLIIAGSDSSGGAGIQADLKTAAAFGVYGMTAITAITAQNTQGVTAVQALSSELVTQQINACLSDIGADAIKIGMLANADIISATASALQGFDGPIILDPVMVATSGDRLLDETALEALKSLIQRATIITPNVPEAEILSSQTLDSAEAMPDVAAELLKLGPAAVLLKGGHLQGEEVFDLLYTPEEAIWFESIRLDTKHTHGTGCTLASAVACGLAAGASLEEAAEAAQEYVFRAIQMAPGFGQGHGPLNHCVQSS